MKNNDQRTLLVVIAIALITFMGILSETALNIAYAMLITELNVTASVIQWLTTGYLLTLSSLIPLSPLLVRRYPTRRLFQVAVLISLAGTMICGLAGAFPLLLTGRIIQAIGTSISLPLMVNIILEAVPTDRRGKIMGIVGLVTCFAPALGPIFGGIVMQYMNWHWIFFFMLPFLLLSLLVGSKYMIDIHKEDPTRADYLSMLLSASAFIGIIYGVSLSADRGWQNAAVLLPLSLGLISISFFVYRQIHLKEPLLNLAVFSYPMFTVGVLIVIISMMLVLAAAFILPLYLQQALGCSSFTAALAMLPGAFLNGIMSPITGRILDRHGPKRLLQTGSLLVAVVMAIFSFFDASLLSVIMLYAIFMFGASMLAMPAQTNGLNQLPAKYNADGAAIVNTLQQVAGAFGTALASSIFTAATKTSPATDATTIIAIATSSTFHFLLILAISGLLISLTVNNNQPPGHTAPVSH